MLPKNCRIEEYVRKQGGLLAALQELLNNVKKEKGEATEEVPTEEIEPEPG